MLLQVRVVHDMKNASMALEDFRDDVLNQSGIDAILIQPLYITCPLQQFGTDEYAADGLTAVVLLLVSWANTVVGMFCKECSLKVALTETVLSCRNRDALAIYVSAWVMQPYIRRHHCEAIMASAEAEFQAL